MSAFQTHEKAAPASDLDLQGGPVELIFFHIALRFESISLIGPPGTYFLNSTDCDVYDERIADSPSPTKVLTK